MKRTITTAFSTPNNNANTPNDDTDNAPTPQRMAPKMRVTNATPHPMGATGISQVTAIQGLGPASQPFAVSRVQVTVVQQASGSTQAKMVQDADVNLTNQYGQTRLILAARDGDLPTVQALLSNDASIYVADHSGCTPLMYAAQNGHLTIVQTLLRVRWLDIDAENNCGATALLMAASNGKEYVVRELIFLGANLNITDNDGWTPLMVAAERGHLPTMQALLSAPSIDIDAKKSDGATALIIAVVNRKDDAVKALINKSVNVNFTSNDGWTPLMFAAKGGHLPTMQALLSALGIDIDVKKTDGATALIVAVGNRKDDAVKALINKGANVNIADDDGWTPLMFAARGGHLPTMQALLSAPGIDIEAKNPDGATALIIAADSGHDDVVKALIIKGANVNAPDNDGWTPLMFAAGHGHLPTMQALLSAADIDIEAKKPNGATALIVAADNGKDDIVKALINKGANVNIADDDGWTPLMFAAQGGRLAAVKTLLTAPDIDVNTQNINEGTVLYVAAYHGRDDVVKALLENGSDINRIYEEIKAINDDSDDDTDDESYEARLKSLEVLTTYLAQRQADVGDLLSEATWASAFTTSAIPPKASQTVMPSLQSLALDTLIQRTQAEGPSLVQLAFQASRDQLLQRQLSATQVVTLISTFSSSPFATALVQTLAVAIKLGGYRTDSERHFIFDALRISGLSDEYEKNKSRLNSKNINRWQVSGQTLLTRAAQAGDQLLVDALINCGAAHHLPDQHGNNALQAAVKAGKWSVCSHLLACGANPDTSDRSGVSTLTYLAQAFAREDEQTAALVAILLAPLVAKGHRLDRVVKDPEASEKWKTTTSLEILQSDPQRYVLYLDLLNVDDVSRQAQQDTVDGRRST